jgi:hypothetical protein
VSIQIQYVGFQLKPKGRDYSYRVLNSKAEPREFIFTISNQAFLDKQIPYQDAAALCYQKLERELLTETPETPLRKHFTISDEELDAYREKYRPARKRG